MLGKSIYECDGILFDVDWSPDGEYLAIVGQDGNLVVMKKNSSDWNFTEIFRNKKERTVRRVSWSPDGSQLITACFDGTATVYNVDFSNEASPLTIKGTLSDQDAELKTARWSPEGDFIVTCSRDKSIYIWSAEDMNFTAIHSEHTGDVKDAVFSPDSTRVISVSYDGTVKVWDPHQEFGSLQTFTEHNGTVWSIAFDEDGDFTTVGEDGQIILYEFIDEKFIVSEKIKLQKELDTLYTVSYRPGQWLVAGANHKIFVIADNFTEVLGEILVNQLGDINSVKANPVHPNIIATANDDGTVVILDSNDAQIKEQSDDDF